MAGVFGVVQRGRGPPRGRTLEETCPPMGPMFQAPCRGRDGDGLGRNARPQGSVPDGEVPWTQGDGGVVGGVRGRSAWTKQRIASTLEVGGPVVGVKAVAPHPVVQRTLMDKVADDGRTVRGPIRRSRPTVRGAPQFGPHKPTCGEQVTRRPCTVDQRGMGKHGGPLGIQHSKASARRVGIACCRAPGQCHGCTLGGGRTRGTVGARVQGSLACARAGQHGGWQGQGVGGGGAQASSCHRVFADDMVEGKRRVHVDGLALGPPTTRRGRRTVRVRHTRWGSGTPLTALQGGRMVCRVQGPQESMGYRRTHGPVRGRRVPRVRAHFVETGTPFGFARVAKESKRASTLGRVAGPRSGTALAVCKQGDRRRRRRHKRMGRFPAQRLGGHGTDSPIRRIGMVQSRGGRTQDGRVAFQHGGGVDPDGVGLVDGGDPSLARHQHVGQEPIDVGDDGAGFLVQGGPRGTPVQRVGKPQTGRGHGGSGRVRGVGVP